jgi:hypothetical protein
VHNLEPTHLTSWNVSASNDRTNSSLLLHITRTCNGGSSSRLDRRVSEALDAAMERAGRRAGHARIATGAALPLLRNSSAAQPQGRGQGIGRQQAGRFRVQAELGQA